MTSVYITIDTEYSSRLFAKLGPSSRLENFKRSIVCETPTGAVGIEYQMDVLDRYNLKAVFFVDPMPALVWGIDAISDIVRPIINRGHDVQLHIHTEWLEFSGSVNPIGNRIGNNIKDFTLEEQSVLIDYAKRTLIEAGAPRPVVFRAGNYGANDDTLRALSKNGINYDTSHCPGIAGSDCVISLSREDRSAVKHCGVIEVPIGCIAGSRGSMRHAQVTAISAAEMIAAIRFSHKSALETFTLVSHSFELLSRDRKRINWILKHRFEELCAALGKLSGVSTMTYAESPPPLSITPGPVPILPHNLLRTGLRMGEQALANALYGAR